MDIHDYYWSVARAFALRLEWIFENEDSLKKAYAQHFPGIPFDRTARWRIILKRELDDVWKTYGPWAKTSMTDYDARQILHMMISSRPVLIDFNIWTQVYCNLQAGNISYRMPTDDELRVLREKWEGRPISPYEPKAKMFAVTASQEQKEFNEDLSTLKAMRIISAQTSDRSFRVSPMGSTPAIADEQNLSMLGVGGDRFLSLPPALTAFYVTWDETPNLLTPRGEGKFTHYQIPRTFFSKSGGEMLNSVLYSRQIAAQVFAFSDPNKYTVVLPRINSVLVISDAEPIAYRDNLQRDLSAEIPGNLKVGLKREFHAD